jgi:hypothetical protein
MGGSGKKTSASEEGDSSSRGASRLSGNIAGSHNLNANKKKIKTPGLPAAQECSWSRRWCASKRQPRGCFKRH